MKKLSQKFRDRLVRNNIKHRQGNQNGYVLKPKNMYPHYPIPENFCIKNKQSRQKILELVQHIRRLGDLGQPLFLDFSNTKVLNASAVAHFMQVINKYEHKIGKITAKASKEPVVKAMLSKLGVHQRCGLPNFNKSHRLVDKWYFCWGNKADFGTQYDEIENALIDNFGKDSEAYQVINNAISEAVANVVNHAYEQYDTYKHWLLFFCINQENQECQIIVSDLGKTIPKTVPITLLEQAKNMIANFSSMTDSDLIELATQYKKTQTNQSYRGKGFEDMQRVCNTVQGSAMMVLSGKGYFLNNQTNTKVIKKETYLEPLLGTIISWSIPLTNM